MPARNRKTALEEITVADFLALVKDPKALDRKIDDLKQQEAAARKAQAAADDATKALKDGQAKLREQIDAFAKEKDAALAAAGQRTLELDKAFAGAESVRRENEAKAADLDAREQILVERESELANGEQNLSILNDAIQESQLELSALRDEIKEREAALNAREAALNEAIAGLKKL